MLRVSDHPEDQGAVGRSHHCDRGRVVPAILYKLSDKGYVSDYKKLAGKRLTRVYYHLEQAGSEYLDSLLEDYLKVQEGVRKVLFANHVDPERI